MKVKGNITWVGAADGVQAEVHLYDRLFLVPQPGTGNKYLLEEINPDSLKSITAYVEPSRQGEARRQSPRPLTVHD